MEDDMDYFTISQLTQACGIILELVGLLWAVHSFGTAQKRFIRDSEHDSRSFTTNYEKEVYYNTVQIIIIGMGLGLQFIALFISN